MKRVAHGEPFKSRERTFPLRVNKFALFLYPLEIEAAVGVEPDRVGVRADDDLIHGSCQ